MPADPIVDPAVAAEYQRFVEGLGTSVDAWKSSPVQGGIYARYSTRHQASVEDQIRDCLECAAREGILVPLENIFVDRAQSGQLRRRPGRRDM